MRNDFFSAILNIHDSLQENFRCGKTPRMNNIMIHREIIFHLSQPSHSHSLPLVPISHLTPIPKMTLPSSTRKVSAVILFELFLKMENQNIINDTIKGSKIN
uniref:Uncharacterized protein n=1 Tax=Cacopsylla melanoneura TaxID=428564 RepID=A0A8D8V0Z3_9HEMI